MANPTRAALAMASVHAANLVDALNQALVSSGHDTHTPGEVVDIIDETLHQLHQVPERAIGESRRRLDAAMERSAALLDELRARTRAGAVMRRRSAASPGLSLARIWPACERETVRFDGR